MWSFPFRFLLWSCLTFSLAALAADIPCTTCHAGYTSGDVHAAVEAACTSCHGDGTEHIAHPAAGGILNFKEDVAKTRSAACTNCHSATHASGIGAHDKAGLACNDCHSIHKEQDDASDAATDEEFERIGAASRVCVGCHEDVFSEFSFSERHRLQEDTLTCTSCHDPHARSKQAQLGGFKDAGCGECHAAKTGPFVFEHAASRVEGCTACHAPHGSPNRHLLAHQQVGELCYGCHVVVPQFHLGFAPVGSPRFGTETVCTNCHVTIHGSNFDRNFLK